jgi:hypothetical protein
MDLNEYWEENKRFVLGVLGALVLFAIARSVVKSIYTDDINTKTREIARSIGELKKPMYTGNDLDRAEEQNEALLSAAAILREATDFVPRTAFALDSSRGSASAQYLRSLGEVREGLLRLAGRANMQLDSSLGLPVLSPTRDVEIERYLGGMDVVDQLVRAAIAAGVDRTEQLRIVLDPGLRSRSGVGKVERTRVSCTLIGTSLALERLLNATQRPDAGRSLHIAEIEMHPSRGKEDEVRLDLTLLIARVTAEEEA